MYTLTVTIHETIGAFVCQAVISEVDQWGKTYPVAKTQRAYLEPLEDGIPEDIAELLKALARYGRILSDSP